MRMAKRRNSKKGGYSDAASYALATVGTANTQYNNVFDISKSQVPGNALVSLNGKQTVGGRRSRSRSRNKSRSRSRSRRRSQKGGLWGGIISKALAPFTLLAMQQSYRRKTRGNQTRRRS